MVIAIRPDPVVRCVMERAGAPHDAIDDPYGTWLVARVRDRADVDPDLSERGGHAGTSNRLKSII
jgi:hypothetical protein